MNRKKKSTIGYERSRKNFLAFCLLLAACCLLVGCENPFFPEKKVKSSGYIEMVDIPSGTSWNVNGSNPSGGTANITAFKISKYQVTQEQYQAVMGSNPSVFHGGTGREPADGEVQGKRPVETVSWYDAIEFCNALSVLEGLTPAYTIDKINQDPNNTNSSDPYKWTVTINAGSNGYRLPTEVQWQYAAQAGTSTETTATANNAWYGDPINGKTHQVGLKEPNAWGLYDMLGNVFEWCWDWHGSTYPNSNGDTDPQGASSGSGHILRGGSWFDSYSTANRGNYNPYGRSYQLGFRLLRL